MNRQYGEAMMESRVERAISSKSQAIIELGQTDENEREQGLGVPLVVEQDVQMVEGVLMEEVGLIDEEDGADALLGKILDVGADGQKQVAGGGVRA